MRNVKFDPDAWAEFTDWQTRDSKIWKKIVGLIDGATRTPFTGRGKPEALKYTYKGYWSRRIDQEHRLVYKVTEEDIIVVSYHGHYV